MTAFLQDGEATLRNVTLTVKPGELLAVVGPVGCGKVITVLLYPRLDL